jgi:eukaryotic-like serine/threonine-protein kinase
LIGRILTNMDPERWRRIAHLYESVLERDPVDRGTFLAAAAQGDEQLRREVESLIAHDAVPVLIDGSVAELAALVMEPDAIFEPGSELGPYRIERLLGEGGMGKVYMATDTRLGRAVAVKVLTPALAIDPKFSARFHREARTIAALAHPHICTLHDVGRQGGIDFLVMEYLEGETLAERLERGALPFAQALACAIEIVGALDAAHHQGIVHRDVKPGNIMLTKAGAKLLDFGLAKPAAPILATTGSRSMPTVPGALTAQGTLGGTFQYMAPEVLDGHEADVRSDLFACGAVLYELFTGRKAFEEKSQAGLIAAIMHMDPPAMAVAQPLTPPLLDRIVRQCLAKNPEERCQSARDLRIQLQWLDEPDTVSAGAPVTAPGTARLHRWAGAVALLASGFLIAFAILRWDSRTNAPADRPVHLAFARPPGTVLSNTGRQMLTISPDGRQIVFVSNGQLYRRPLNAAEASPIAGTQNLAPTTPTFSPDGRWVAFTSAAYGGLKKVPIEGGVPVALLDSETGGNFGLNWAADRSIVLAKARGVFRVPAAGGTASRIFEPRPNEVIYGPQLLPDGNHLLLTVTTATGPERWDRAQVIAYEMSSGIRTVLIDGGADGRYLSTGHIVYAVGPTLFAAPFNLRELKTIGAPTAVVQGIFRSNRPGATTGAAHVAISNNGTLAYLPAAAADTSMVALDVTLDQSSKATPVTSAGPGRFPRLSPDGARAVTVTDDDFSLWVWSMDGRAAPRRLSVARPNTDPVWTPDGSMLAFRAQRDSSWGIYLQRADGMDAEKRLLAVDGRPAGWSRDGAMLYYVSGRQLWSWRSGSAPQKLPVDRIQRDVSLSPDRMWAAFHTDERQQATAYIQSTVTPGARFQISADGAYSPLWAPDGKKLFYVTQEGNRLMAVDVQTAPNVVFGQAVVVAPEIFQATALTNRNYDITSDGKRLLTQMPDRTHTASQQIVVVLHWFDELKRLVPTK